VQVHPFVGGSKILQSRALKINPHYCHKYHLCDLPWLAVFTANPSVCQLAGWGEMGKSPARSDGAKNPREATHAFGRPGLDAGRTRTFADAKTRLSPGFSDAVSQRDQPAEDKT
jgi:hypothetical protein